MTPRCKTTSDPDFSQYSLEVLAQSEQHAQKPSKDIDAPKVSFTEESGYDEVDLGQHHIDNQDYNPEATLSSTKGVLSTAINRLQPKLWQNKAKEDIAMETCDITEQDAEGDGGYASIADPVDEAKVDKECMAACQTSVDQLNVSANQEPPPADY